jgi:PRC-barrel domain protein
MSGIGIHKRALLQQGSCMTNAQRFSLVFPPALLLLAHGVAPLSATEARLRTNIQASGQEAAAVGATQSPTLALDQAQLQSVLGREVRTRIDQDMGRVIDLLADAEGRVQAAVIEFGGFLGIGTRKIAVEWSALRFEADGKQPLVIVDMTRDQLRAAPEFKPAGPAIVRKASE